MSKQSGSKRRALYTVEFKLEAGYGLRQGEVAALKRSSIDWQALTLQVEQSKTRSILLMPLAPDTIDVLRRYVDRYVVASIESELFGSAPIQHALAARDRLLWLAAITEYGNTADFSFVRRGAPAERPVRGRSTLRRRPSASTDERRLSGRPSARVKHAKLASLMSP